MTSDWVFRKCIVWWRTDGLVIELQPYNVSSTIYLIQNLFNLSTRKVFHLITIYLTKKELNKRIPAFRYHSLSEELKSNSIIFWFKLQVPQREKCHEEHPDDGGAGVCMWRAARTLALQWSDLQRSLLF